MIRIYWAGKWFEFPSKEAARAAGFIVPENDEAE